jgi:hypothetical protein
METTVAVGLGVVGALLLLVLGFAAWNFREVLGMYREEMESLRRANESLLDRLSARDLQEFTTAQVHRQHAAHLMNGNVAEIPVRDGIRPADLAGAYDDQAL